jgi:hypothetical protein
MPIGAMQYGTTNDAGADPTALTSANVQGNQTTLTVTNSAPPTPAAEFPTAVLAVGLNGVIAEGQLQGVKATGLYALTANSPSSTSGFGVIAQGRTGAFGDSAFLHGVGVRGRATGPVSSFGVWGESDSTSAAAAGVHGTASGYGSNGIIAEANNGPMAYALWAKSTSGYAGVFAGPVKVNGSLIKSAGGFRIDHPLDPANKYLNHSFAESPQPLNIYCGKVRTDSSGTAVVELPEYFEALNTDFTYQLTVIGTFAQAIVAEEIEKNRFTISTDTPSVLVSWQVAGVRRDPYISHHPITVEEDKPDRERGTYLFPEGYDQPPERGIDHAREQSLREAKTDSPEPPRP